MSKIITMLSTKEFKKNLKLQIRNFKDNSKFRILAEKQMIKQAKLAEKKMKEQEKLVEKQIKAQQKIFKKCLKQITSNLKDNVDGRHVARANETIRIRRLIELMSDKTNNTLGNQLCQEYEKKFNTEILRIEEAGTNRDHYDIIIYHTDGSFKRVEEKHSEKTLNTNVAPWRDSVQVLNGVGNQFLVGEKMAKIWYDEVIVPTKWNEILECSDIPEIPEYDEWIKDAFRCGDPKTEFVKKIKSRCREVWGDKSSFTGLNNTPDLRSSISDFTLTDEETGVFIKQVKDKLDDVLSQKDCFLQTKGDIDSGSFEFSWRDSVSSPNITSINIRREKDIFIDLIDDKNESFTGILRWGKGCGFTNIRFDVR